MSLKIASFFTIYHNMQRLFLFSAFTCILCKILFFLSFSFVWLSLRYRNAVMENIIKTKLLCFYQYKDQSIDLQVAYFLGHSNLHLTICIPKRAKMLVCSPNEGEELRKHIERRNESYHMAFCYLRDMAERRRCEVSLFSY